MADLGPGNPRLSLLPPTPSNKLHAPAHQHTSPVSSGQLPSEGASAVGGGGLLALACASPFSSSPPLSRTRLVGGCRRSPSKSRDAAANRLGRRAKSSATAPPNHSAVPRAVVQPSPAGVRRSGHLAAPTQQAATSTGPQAAISPHDLIAALQAQHRSRVAPPL